MKDEGGARPLAADRGTGNNEIAEPHGSADHGGAVVPKADGQAVGVNWASFMAEREAARYGAFSHDLMNGNAEAGLSEIDAEDISPAFSDDQLALQFVREFGSGFRWTPGMGWMCEATDHWERDDLRQRFNAARNICRSGAAIAPEKLRTPIASARTVAAVVTLAQSDPRLVVPPDQWDQDPMILNTPPGVIDLRTGRMRSRNQQDHLTQVTAVAPDFGMVCPTWSRCLADVFSKPEIIECIQRMFGYFLTGDRREQKLFCWIGDGANGKSTLTDLLLRIMGTYALKLPTAALMQSAIDRHPTELAQLRGKRLASSNELEEGSFWAESLIKELTGDATLRARFMRQDFFEFAQTQKHLIAGNHRPRLRGADPAMARRMILIPFTQVFAGARKDKALPQKLLAEAPGILGWMIAGAGKWHADGLAIPSQVMDASSDYMAEHDDLALWVEECCHLDPEASDTAANLYASFRLWKKDRGEQAPSMTVWAPRLAQVSGVSKRKSSTVRYVGISLTYTASSTLQSSRGGV